MKKTTLSIFIILFFSYFAIKPFFIQGFFPMHDDTQVARVFEMGKMLKSGTFPVRWVPDLGYGYGYPIFNFYAPLAYYVGGGFTLFGFDALVATKIMMALGIIMAGVSMYFLAREFFGEFGGIISGLFYLYAPYHAVEIFVRGDVAEFWAYAFIPLAFLGIYKKNILLGTIGLAGLILSHNLTAMMVTPLLLVAILLNCYIAFKNKKSFVINSSSLIFLLGLLVSSFYWLPALLELRNTNLLSQVGGGADFRDHFVCISQLWDSLWAFGGSVAGCTDGLSFKIGKLHILVTLAVTILIILVSKIRKKGDGAVIGLSLFGFFLSIFLMLEISKPIWEAIPTMAFFQYPWRLLILASFFSSFLSGALIFIAWQLKLKAYAIGLALTFFLLFFNIKLFVPQTIIHKIAADYTNEHSLKWIASRMSDEYLSPNFKKPRSEMEIAKDKAIKPNETVLQKTSNIISFIGVIIIGIILFKKIKLGYE